MDKQYDLREGSNSSNNKINQLYDRLLEDFGLSRDDCYVQINPSLFAINEYIFRDKNN